MEEVLRLNSDYCPLVATAATIPMQSTWYQEPILYEDSIKMSSEFVWNFGLHFWSFAHFI
jgi:hypothetical protein